MGTGDESTGRRDAKRRRGVAAVELALILPVLITIVLGCVDFGRFAHTHIAVTNAARVGAAFGAVTPMMPNTQSAWAQILRQRVIDEMGSGFDPELITIATPVITTDPGNLRRVRVQVSYPFQMLVDWPLLPASMTLTQAVEMRVIR
jgi:hypothetical protein